MNAKPKTLGDMLINTAFNFKSMKKILITGSNGQLGSELRELAPSYSEYEFVFLTRDEFSLDKAEGIEELLRIHQPNYFVNGAAYTAVDKAEAEKDQAFQIN